MDAVATFRSVLSQRLPFRDGDYQLELPGPNDIPVEPSVFLDDSGDLFVTLRILMFKPGSNEIEDIREQSILLLFADELDLDPARIATFVEATVLAFGQLCARFDRRPRSPGDLMPVQVVCGLALQHPAPVSALELRDLLLDQSPEGLMARWHRTLDEELDS